MSRAGRRAWYVVVVALVAVAVPWAARSVADAAVPGLPSGFSETVVWSGLELPTAIEFAPDGKVFVAEKSGIVKMFASLADSTPTVVADLRTRVHNYWDRGLLGLAVDPRWLTNPNLYVLYTYDHVLGDPAPAPRWGTPGSTYDGCPDPPGANADGCVVSGRLSKLPFLGVTTGPEQVLVEDWCAQYPSHTVGDLAFGPDGALYASAGDGANFNFEDYGQLGSPRNPCGDPPGGVGAELVKPTSEGGALRSQDLLTRGDPLGLDGTVIRIDPDTGAGRSGNPLAGDPDPNARRVVAHGLRNPFRFALRPGSAELWVADVGWGNVEEVNRIAAPVDAVVDNFGWPCFEGPDARYTGFDLCRLVQQQTAPLSYRHSEPFVVDDGCPTGGSSISGLAFYGGGTYPVEYDGALVVADYSRRCLWAVPPGADGSPDRARARVLRRDLAVVDVATGPNGDLFVVDVEGGSVRRISYTAGNTPPRVAVQATPSSGGAPLDVTFTSTGTSDPDPGDSLTYAWELDGDGDFDDATRPTASFTFATEGTYVVELRATDTRGVTGSATTTVTVGNTPPVATISAPVASTTFAVGDVIAFSGGATDAEQGQLPASALTWTLIQHHCADGGSCHAHLVQRIEGVAIGSFAAPDHEYPSYLELRLQAVDGGGLADLASVELQPRTVTLKVVSDPPGLQLGLNGSTSTAPISRRVIVGSRNTLAAPSPQTSGTTSYAFTRWSDDGASSHDLLAPATDTTYTATYAAQAAGAVPPPSAGGWQRNGSATLTSAGALVLTPNKRNQAGSAFWPEPVPTSGLKASFDVLIGGGTGGEGLTFVLADPAAGATPTSLGDTGTGLGLRRIPGVAVVLDTYGATGEPAGEYVALATGTTTSLTYTATATAVPPLRNATRRVGVEVVGSRVVVTIDGVTVLDRTAPVPPTALVGFTAGTSRRTDRHQVSAVDVRLGGRVVATPSGVDFGTVDVGALVTRTVTLTNLGTAAVTIEGIDGPAAPFSASGPPAGTSLAGGATASLTVRVTPAIEGTVASSVTVRTSAGPVAVGLVVTGRAVPSVPPPTEGGWQLNGQATLAGADLVLTDLTQYAAGSAFWPVPVLVEGLRVAFDAAILDGTGADGMSLVLADPARGATAWSLGVGGGGLGASGIPGVAVALDTFRNGTDPSSSFVGIATAGDADNLVWTATADVAGLQGSTRRVEVEVLGDSIVVRLGGTEVLRSSVALPAEVLVGFTAATGWFTNRHVVRNVSVSR